MANPNYKIILITALTSILTLCTGCGNKGKASPEDLQAACNKARSLAIELSAQTDTMRIENILLEVRERENYMRHHGYSDVADVYIETFLATLDSVSPAIAKELR